MPGPRKKKASGYPRDLVGYGATPPKARWPGGARIALQFVLNYEEGSENAILHGDAASESFLSEMVAAQPIPGARNMSMESLFEYGSRVGVWRVLALFRRYGPPATVDGGGNAMQRKPAGGETLRPAAGLQFRRAVHPVPQGQLRCPLRRGPADAAHDVDRPALPPRGPAGQARFARAFSRVRGEKTEGLDRAPHRHRASLAQALSAARTLSGSSPASNTCCSWAGTATAIAPGSLLSMPARPIGQTKRAIRSGATPWRARRCMNRLALVAEPIRPAQANSRPRIARTIS